MPQALWAHLIDDATRARLTDLRLAVEPILANNLAPHFTAHDVAHCDRLTQVIDQFIGPLQSRPDALTQTELFILYQAAYLHDIGMHYEHAGDSRSLVQPLQGRVWTDLSQEERSALLREHHPRLSAELVRTSVRNGTPPIGATLRDGDFPAVVAALCEAHGLDVSSAEYAELTQGDFGLRVGLLTAVLRCADILEESRQRANRTRAESLILPLDSQVHWWRHYYTVDVRFDAGARSITLWFDFPVDRRDELARIVPDLQVPFVREELSRHESVLAPVGLTWVVTSRVATSPYSTAELLPEDVLKEMLIEIGRRRQLAAEVHRSIVARGLEEARPYLERQLAAFRDNEAALPPEEAVQRLRALSRDASG